MIEIETPTSRRKPQRADWRDVTGRMLALPEMHDRLAGVPVSADQVHVYRPRFLPEDASGAGRHEDTLVAESRTAVAAELRTLAARTEGLPPSLDEATALRALADDVEARRGEGDQAVLVVAIPSGQNVAFGHVLASFSLPDA